MWLARAPARMHAGMFKEDQRNMCTWKHEKRGYVHRNMSKCTQVHCPRQRGQQSFGVPPLHPDEKNLGVRHGEDLVAILGVDKGVDRLEPRPGVLVDVEGHALIRITVFAVGRAVRSALAPLVVIGGVHMVVVEIVVVPVHGHRARFVGGIHACNATFSAPYGRSSRACVQRYQRAEYARRHAHRYAHYRP